MISLHSYKKTSIRSPGPRPPPAVTPILGARYAPVRPISRRPRRSPRSIPEATSGWATPSRGACSLRSAGGSRSRSISSCITTPRAVERGSSGSGSGPRSASTRERRSPSARRPDYSASCWSSTPAARPGARSSCRGPTTRAGGELDPHRRLGGPPYHAAGRRVPGFDRGLRPLLGRKAVRAGPLVGVQAVAAERPAAHRAAERRRHPAPRALADEHG